MAEILSPSKQRILIASRLQSPTNFIGPNDDTLERAQARAARAAAIRRKTAASSAAAPPPPPDLCLDKQQILDLFNNCIKLASENKINQKNTWELGLIDHLYDVIKVEQQDDIETNFQKASCTLEAGIKIYSMRVDSVHSEAYKVLGGINRVGREDEQDNVVDEDGSKDDHDEGNSKKESNWKVSPSSTLESSFESLNVKKFDVAFAVDPLYHQTSAQFDEGGAKGLLLNNLGIYGGCQVLFDSFEVPGKSMASGNKPCNQESIDLSFAKDCIDKMVKSMGMSEEISPSLKHIVNLFDESNQRPPITFTSVDNVNEEFHETCNNTNDDNAELDDTGVEDCATWGFENEDPNGEDPISGGDYEENEPSIFQPPNVEDGTENVDEYLFLSLGLNLKHNAWAGPDHWKYQKVKGVTEASKVDELPVAKKAKSKKQMEVDIDFTQALENDMSNIFAPPKNPKSLLLPRNRAPCNTKLPEDCHYEPENLVKLFLLPKVMCLGRRKGIKSSEECEQEIDNDEQMASWEDNGGEFGNEDVHSDVEDTDTLVPQPRQVNKIEVNYDKTSKHVDVQALKETVWSHLQAYKETTTQDEEEEMISFKKVLADIFPTDCKTAPTEDISPHLCFICLLHLANEHGLSIRGCTNFDDLTIHVPSDAKAV
ncbi:condensin complex subunit 2 isoform X2 [Impatiens glandulifera]|uniref:condensin complex subunit 2 isoform X2 n=1 Tax=Impatiens glandulifera TaxID=253017 RepID=UPI001FB0C712|nr:condensin complex subunit 2 isoform X2 [Impatiens glandulifera]